MINAGSSFKTARTQRSQQSHLVSLGLITSSSEGLQPFAHVWETQLYWGNGITRTTSLPLCQTVSWHSQQNLLPEWWQVVTGGKNSGYRVHEQHEFLSFVELHFCSQRNMQPHYILDPPVFDSWNSSLVWGECFGDGCLHLQISHGVWSWSAPKDIHGLSNGSKWGVLPT